MWRGLMPGTLSMRLTRPNVSSTQMPDQPEHARHLMGEVDALRIKMYHQLATDTDALIAQTQQALENTPRQWYMVRSVAWLHLALAYQKIGRLDLAYATLAAGRREDTAEVGVVRGRIGGMNCYVQWIAADLPAMLQTAADTPGRRPATSPESVPRLGTPFPELRLLSAQRTGCR